MTATAKKLDKILEAESLINNKIEDRTKYTPLGSSSGGSEHLEKAIKIYKSICLNLHLSIEDRYNAMVSFMKHVPDEAIDMLSRWRDMLPFLRNEEERDLVALLARITRSADINAHERSITAVTLYNRSYLEVCYTCFADLASDNTVLIQYRADACRYLFGSGTDENKELAQECLTGIIESNEYPLDFRYKLIAGYISKTGIATMLNATKLKVPYDEKFVYGLQHVFFTNEDNFAKEKENIKDRIPYRILSGQHLLDMSCVSLEEKIEIGNILLGISKDTSYPENIRADAADVVLRLGTDEQSKEARNIITDMGFSTVDTADVKNTLNPLLSKARTIYSNEQNVHDKEVSEVVLKFIEKMVQESKFTMRVQARPYHEIHQEVSDLIRSKSINLSPADKIKAYKALNRVAIDTATFTKYRVTLAEIFVHVWLRIKEYNESKRSYLEGRLVQELLEMEGWCSSGHSTHFVNALAGEDADLRISWESQIIANIAGRMNALVRDMTDQDRKASITMGMLKDADPQDRKIYIKFVEESLVEIQKQLYKEFVKDGYIKDDEFQRCFEKGKRMWIVLDSKKVDNTSSAGNDNKN